MAATALQLDDVETAVDVVLERLGPRIVVGLPLGLGKPVELVNALYRRACRDDTIELRILTALSLEPPQPGSGLERAFMAPFIERVFAGVPTLDYLPDLHAGRLPANVTISEFYLRPGAMLGNAHAQQHYISSNYTHAARDVFNQGCNLVAQQVSRRSVGGEIRYSLSCNPDTGPELLQLLRDSGRPHLALAVVNQNLPYFGCDAEVGADGFDLVVDDPRYSTPLFPLPKTPVSTAEHCIGLHASALVRDGGTLQIGIGALGDAVVHALQLRQREPAAYAAALTSTGALAAHGGLIAALGGTAPFAQGLYGATEMFVDGFWHLLRAGILKRRVYDFWALQQLINDNRCDPDRLQPEVLERLAELGVGMLRAQDFATLQRHGLFTGPTRYAQGRIIAPDGESVPADLSDPGARAVLVRCLGGSLRDGRLLHAGFFLGAADFYRGLHELDADTRAAICMTGVSKTNQLDHNPRLYRLQRRDARFINTGMLATLSGAVCSDGLENGQVVSGVGGQYNFVAQAHQLPGGRSVLLIRAVREGSDGRASSNIVFNYGHITIPRHLRDIVVTEYGIADLRSKTDAEVAAALIEISDARFAPQLIDEAVRAGKLSADYRLPERCRAHTPEHLERALAASRAVGHFGALPLGSDFTDEERALLPVLQQVRERARRAPKWRLLLGLLRPAAAPDAEARAALARLDLAQPQGLEDRVARRLVLSALAASQSA